VTKFLEGIKVNRFSRRNTSEQVLGWNTSEQVRFSGRNASEQVL
jgi:hypothetical protein